MTAPTTTGTYTFFPPLGDLIIAAYGRCGIRRMAITVEHLNDAAMASNLMQVEWANNQVNLWTVDLQSIPLVLSQATYAVSDSTIMVMASYIETTINGVTDDRIITSIDRDTYASYPDKTTDGQPTVYWYQALREPQITLWQPPDQATIAANAVLKFYRARQIQDAAVPNGLHPEIPYRFLEAYVSGLAVKLAELYAPDQLMRLVPMAKMAWDSASQRDVENASLRVYPAMSIYTSAVYQ
jgi:hypothetical protein